MELITWESWRFALYQVKYMKEWGSGECEQLKMIHKKYNENIEALPWQRWFSQVWAFYINSHWHEFSNKFNATENVGEIKLK